jgi:hypothetical protein
MKPVIALLLSIAFLSCKPAPPRILIDRQIVDLGRVDALKQDTVRQEFHITNFGGSPLRIIRARTDCSCTSASWDTLIAPRSRGRLVVSIAVRDFKEGFFAKSVRVSSSAVNVSEAVLLLKGTLARGPAAD